MRKQRKNDPPNSVTLMSQQTLPPTLLPAAADAAQRRLVQVLFVGVFMVSGLVKKSGKPIVTPIIIAPAL